MSMGSVLVTGASGFVGRTVVTDLRSRGWQVRPTANSKAGPGDVRIALTPDADWSEALAGCDSVVHLGARAHVLNETVSDPLATFMSVNCDATLALARASQAAGVKRFIFVSSIAVHGHQGDMPLTEDAQMSPNTDYGRSKMMAEVGLRALAEVSSMTVTTLRPPLVYGPGVGARFLQLVDWCNRELPLPLGTIHNRRSFLAVSNLADAITTCLTHPNAPGQTFLVADNLELSTPDMLRLVSAALGVKSRLFGVPVPLLNLAALAIGKRQVFAQLSSSLVLDTSKLRAALNWTAPQSTEAALAELSAWYSNRTVA